MKIAIKPVPAYLLLVAALLGAFLSYSFFSIANKNNNQYISEEVSKTPSNFSNNCAFTIRRLAGHQLIKPLLFAERSCEDQAFATIKSSVTGIIENLKAKNIIDNASVYVRVFKDGQWMSINEDIKYKPGSLFKVPLLITYLRLSEERKGVLEAKIPFVKVTNEAKGFKQEFVKDAIVMGNSYTVKELLTYMICHSDNNATMLLMNSIPFAEFQKTFTDLGLSKDLTQNEAVISAKEYASFWIALYNSSYLNFNNSEFALSLLTQSDFNEGITKNIPSSVKVAHKFGEKGDANYHAFAETGIVYANNTPYLISIMTEGKEQAKLPSVIQEISASVYNNIQGLTQ
ncbi:MAG: serine hydrolase [Chitinophagaceae bacterium]